ncbi:hypothetical protein SUGI_0219350 [Cryptomeria japonica]|nr:hypothetical protein SUGI_0219350 [Cryptomeria japonica]
MDRNPVEAPIATTTPGGATFRRGGGTTSATGQSWADAAEGRRATGFTTAAPDDLRAAEGFAAAVIVLLSSYV